MMRVSRPQAKPFQTLGVFFDISAQNLIRGANWIQAINCCANPTYLIATIDDYKLLVDVLRKYTLFNQLRLNIEPSFRLTNDMIAELGRFSEITSLDCGANTLDPANIHYLGPHLQDLDLSWSQDITDPAMSLSHLPILKCLDVSYCPITSQGICNLADIKSLKFLILNGLEITDDCISYLPAQLEFLSLCMCVQLTDLALEHLATMCFLKELNLGHCKFTDRGVLSLIEIDTLKILDIHSCFWVRDYHLDQFSGMTGLHELRLTGCTGITMDGLARLARVRPDLKITV